MDKQSLDWQVPPHVQRRILGKGMSGQAATARPRREPNRRSARRPAAEAAPGAIPQATAAGLLAAFLVATFLPVYVDVAGLRLTPIRLFLLAGFLPMLIRWLSGAAGRIAVGDVLIVLHGVWIGVAIFAVHGSSRIPFIGITVVETVGAYLAGRLLVRNVTDYRFFFRCFLIALALLAPFVVVENLTGRLVLNETLGALAPTPSKAQAGAESHRLGLVRAQSVMEHPILWGVVCSIAIANVYFLYGSRWPRRLALAAFTTAMTFTSLSSGPLLAVALQIIMIGWGWITRNAWWALIGLAVLAYVAIDLLSNRTPVQVLISYLTFSPANAYTRLAIWDYGSAEVLRHPLFGIGLNNWERPSWMTSSVDNFWLATAMRYGLPGVLLLMAGIAANLVQIIRADLPDRLKPVRDGYVIATAGTLMVLSTVHIWGSAAALILFYLGAGTWMFTGGAAAEATDDAADEATDEAAAEAEPVRAAARARAARGPEPAAARPGAAEPAAPAALSDRRGPGKAERLARRQAQYSRPRP
jgi:hypothetical protein